MKPLFVAAVIALVSALTPGVMLPEYGGVVSLPVHPIPLSLDPLEASLYAEKLVTGAVFEPLYRLDAGGTVTPLVAASLPAPTASGAKATIPLAPGVVFGDGTPLTAKVAKKALDRLAIPHVTWKTSGDDALIAYLSGGLTVPALLEKLASPAMALVHESKGSLWGTGPFLPATSSNGSTLTLEARLDHHLGRPYLDSVVLVDMKPDAEPDAFYYGKLDVTFIPPIRDLPTTSVSLGPRDVVTAVLVPALWGTSGQPIRAAIRSWVDTASLVKHLALPAKAVAPAGPSSPPVSVPSISIGVPSDEPGLGDVAQAMVDLLAINGVTASTITVTPVDRSLLLAGKTPVVPCTMVLTALCLDPGGAGSSLPSSATTPLMTIERVVHHKGGLQRLVVEGGVLSLADFWRGGDE